MWPTWLSIVLLGLKYQEPKSKLEIRSESFFVCIETPRLSHSRPRPGRVVDPWQCTDQVLLTVNVMCNLVFFAVVCLCVFCLFVFLLFFLLLFFGWGGGGYFQKRRQSFRVFNLYQGSGCCQTPVCRLLGLAPFSWVSNTQNWNRSVGPGANFLVWLIKKQILVLREPVFEFSTLAQETEPGSVQARSTICYIQGVAPFYSFKYKFTEMESMLGDGRSRFCCFVPII